MQPEAERLFAQAREDWPGALSLLQAERFYAGAFSAQKTAEKALHTEHLPFPVPTAL
ncbi:MAG: hypothetical protein ABDH20_08905 [Thermus sp.]